MSVRLLQLNGIPDLVRIHLASFEGFFLSFLGPRFLRELYTGILNDISGIVYVYEAEGLYRGLLRELLTLLASTSG